MNVSAFSKSVILLVVLLVISLGAPGYWSVARAQGVASQAGVVYGEVGGEKLLLDIYQRPTSGHLRPAVLIIHGGGSIGSRTDTSEFARSLAAAGYVTFNIDYRLVNGTNNRWPAQLDDAQLAVRWIRANASQYDVAPDRICAFGHSFGGQLAALLGMRDTANSGELPLATYSSRATCVVDLAGSVDPTEPLQSDGAGMDVQLMGGKVQDIPARYRDASALDQVSATTAPFLIFHGTDDEIVPVKESRLLVDALHSAGVPVVYVENPHATHFYWLNFFRPGSWDNIGPETLAFLARYTRSG